MDDTITAEPLTGQVFNIQRFSTHDGPGIRTTVFLKGCPLRCAWCQNPESQSLEPVLMFNQAKCTACGRCVPACPVGANTIQGGECVLNRRTCLRCGKCVSACLNGARSIEGKPMTVAEVMCEVLKDVRAYDNSGGGMTLSGGDCEMQPEFSVALLRAAQDESIHTAVELTGVYPWDIVKSIADNADLILYDLKGMDEKKHKLGTGVSNKRILENARRLTDAGMDVLFRMPLIPGYNDSPEDVRAVANFVRETLGLDSEHLELLAYNNLGENKYSHIDRADEQPSHERQSNQYIEELQAVCAAA